MEDRDLPDPTLKKRPDFSEQELKNHFGKILVAATGLSLIYAGIHKILIPLGLGFLKVSNQSYAQIDYTWGFGYLFWTVLRKTKINENLLGLSAGIVLGDGLWEAYQISTEQVEGWLQISRVLSSFPLALMGLWALVRMSSKKLIALGWVGGILLWAFMLVVHPWLYHSSSASAEISTPLPTQENPLETHPIDEFLRVPVNSCGNSIFYFSTPDLEEIPFSTKSQIRIDTCGLSPSLLKIEPSIQANKPTTLEIVNATSDTVNLHLLVFDQSDGSVKKSMNFVLQKNSRKSFGSQISLRPGELGLLFSDGFEKLGIVGIVTDDNRSLSVKNGKFCFSRKPLSAFFKESSINEL